MNFAPSPRNVSPVGPPTGFFAEGSAPIRPPRELIKGVTAVDGVTFIGGQSGAAKTYIECDMSVAMSSPDEGSAFFGRPVRERIGVIILAAEGGGTIANRIEVAKRQRQINDRLPLLWKSDIPNLSDRKNVAAIIASLKDAAGYFDREFSVRLGAVFIDTVSAAFGMRDENDNAEAARIVGTLRAIGTATGALMLPVHHYGKTADSGLRGGSAYRANADGIISVNANRNETTGKVTSRSLAVAKYRDGEEGPIGDFDLKFMPLGEDEYGDTFGNCYVEPALETQLAPPKPKKLSDRGRLGLEALHEAVADRGQPLPATLQMPAGMKAVEVEDWRAEVIRRGIIDADCSNPRVYFRRLKDELKVAHAATETDGFIWPVRST